ncbi:MAG: phenylalanine--tRNA ligase subunit beta [Muribaculaceae bacterium]|nr:phenylalanine--tRNA ligase subunit beta [Muribaculaceae bacterium]
MNISYKWLKRYIDVPLQPRDLAAALTSTGLECDSVEEVETIRGGLRGLRIGRVLTCVPHPDSDHLHVTTVDVGDKEPLQIVCGAPNVAAGQTVVVATIGTVLYDGDKEFKIKKSKMRGVESFGMICAEDEIGLGSDHAGIMVLPEGIAPGTPAAEYFNVESDYRLEVELTPNRVDAASHYGVARDLKAWLTAREAMGDMPASDTHITLPDASAFSVDSPEGAVVVRVDDNRLCPRYSGVTVRGVKVAESPEWLKNLLVAAGQRPINNIVDITNFILLGLGQPLHCFDLAHVKGEEIVVRTCAEGTPFTTLDGVERKLSAADLMICDVEKPLCIAGVFGGLDSGVTEETTDVFIESAWFNPTSVRRTARRHGLSTDASFRYERGTDPLITIYAARLAAVMIREMAGGRICGEIIDICPEAVKPVEMEFSLAYCDSLIGKHIPSELVEKILKALDFEVKPGEDPDTLRLTVPPYRVDVTRPCDVVEEILRIYGYNNVETPSRVSATLSRKTAVDESYTLQQLLSEQLTAEGFHEILNNSLSAASYYEDNAIFTPEACVRVINPLSGDLSVMRRTLLYGGLETLAHNINRRASDLRLYEFGNVYSRNPEKTSTPEAPLAPFHEEMRLDLWMSGNAAVPSWNRPAAPLTVFDLKATVLNLLCRAGLPETALTQTQSKDDIFAARLDLSLKTGKTIASLGILSRAVLKKADIEQEVLYATIDWNAMMRAVSKHEITFTPLPRTQAVRRDLALLLDRDIPFSRVEDVIRKAERKLLGEVRLFDVYEGDKLPAGKKSYAVTITLQDPEKTLADKQIDSVMSRITAQLGKELGAELR